MNEKMLKMKAALDVYYVGDAAKAVCLLFRDWPDEKPAALFQTQLTMTAGYVPGQFYKRELPCLMAVLQQVELSTIDCLIVDGFVHLDDNNTYGLGGYLYEALQQKIPVIGVAKRKFHSNKNNMTEVKRGSSKQPLYITAVGISLTDAARSIQRMAGEYRMPALLKQLDQLTKIS